MTKKFTNRLINETSPYLLQHAHNPVDWYPWGDEAIRIAQKLNKPLLISIGYSTCHWCHVMAHETFEDFHIANLMNENFICIKVDREELPDVDQMYMDAVQLMTGRGGWPLNCFALPDGRPFYGGTYFRKNDWSYILEQLVEMYKNEPEKINDQANSLADGLKKQGDLKIKTDTEPVTKDALQLAYKNMAEGFDVNSGGFNGAPKFPMPTVWEFVNAYKNLFSCEEAEKQLLQTLDKMALGGIYDHVGGGFSRYSVDTDWKVPHFEKMLYDNAQLISLYSKAYRIKSDEHYKRVVYETINFVLHELTSDEISFYSALDADSEGEEGRFYVWSYNELAQTLGCCFEKFSEYYKVTPEGNWENGKNILNAREKAIDFATKYDMRLDDFLGDLEIAETRLIVKRGERVRPGLDDKVITSWNALMCRALIDAYRTFDNKVFLDRAIKSARFIRDKMLDSNLKLYRTYKNGERKIDGYLDDYSFTIDAFIALYQITFDEEWLLLSKRITDKVIRDFYDEKRGFFFYAMKNKSGAVVRSKEITDNVIPSSNSSMGHNLFVLSKYFLMPEYETIARRMTNTLFYEISSYTRFYANWAHLGVRFNSANKEVVVTGPLAVEYMEQIKRVSNENILLALAFEKSRLPIMQNRFRKEETLIFVCKNSACHAPVRTTGEALMIINSEG